MAMRKRVFRGCHVKVRSGFVNIMRFGVRHVWIAVQEHQLLLFEVLIPKVKMQICSFQSKLLLGRVCSIPAFDLGCANSWHSRCEASRVGPKFRYQYNLPRLKLRPALQILKRRQQWLKQLGNLEAACSKFVGF